MKAVPNTIIVSVVALILPLGSLFADKSDDLEGRASLPDIQFKERVFDFGVVYKGDKVIHSYKFKNAGRGVLKIERVRSSCGCTAVNITSTEVEPGGCGEIKAIFHSKNYKGRTKKYIFVHSNDPDEPVITLEITGIVRVDVAVVPNVLDFGDIYEGEAVSKKLRVLPVELGELKIGKLEVTSKYLTVKRSQYSEGSKEGVEFTITLSPEVPRGRFTDKLEIHTNSSIQPVIQVPVWGTVFGKIKVSPDEFSFEVAQGDSKTFEITLNQGEKRTTSINKVEDELGYFTAEISFLRYLPQEGGEMIYRVKLKPTPDAPVGSFGENLHLYTNDNKQPVIKIFLRGVIH